MSVRFGNVLGSRGSVLTTFERQIRAGGPVTVTDPDVTRFFMTISEACQLVLQASTIGDSGQAMVLDMGKPVRIADVAQTMIDVIPHEGEIEIVYTGLREGEKLHEDLFGLNEPQDRRPSTLSSRTSTSHRLIRAPCRPSGGRADTDPRWRGCGRGRAPGRGARAACDLLTARTPAASRATAPVVELVVALLVTLGDGAPRASGARRQERARRAERPLVSRHARRAGRWIACALGVVAAFTVAALVETRRRGRCWQWRSFWGPWDSPTILCHCTRPPSGRQAMSGAVMGWRVPLAVAAPHVGSSVVVLHREHDELHGRDQRDQWV